MGCASSTDATDDGSNKYPVRGENSIMNRKAHGTSATPVQNDLRWECDRDEADRICNYNRHFAERAGSFAGNSNYKKEFQEFKRNGEMIKFYDSNTGKLLFHVAGDDGYRSHDAFWKESHEHGWPSFRDEEVNWDYVRCLKNGECVSVDGTHLGHNLPDKSGNRYCINLVSIAGRPTEAEKESATE